MELGPFRLDALIGRGGMGQVWAGVHRLTSHPVAVKVLTARGFRKAGFLEAFRREARSVAGLDHPNIVRVYDYGEADADTAVPTGEPVAKGTPWLAMELVKGGTLAPLGGRLTWSEVESVILALLDALGHAHARGVVHRDLKPGNVLVVPDPGETALHVKLTDFGLAQEIEAALVTDGTPFAGGTPAYMAPEQFEGRWRDYGPWTDLYAVGCLFWALLRGQPPYGSTSSVSEKREQHLHAPLPPLLAPFPVPQGFERWLARLLEKEPARRFRRAADAIAAFRRLGPPLDLGPPGSPDVPSAVDTLLLGEDTTQPAEATTLTLRREDTTGTALAIAAPAVDVPPPPADWRAPEAEDGGRDAALTGLGLFGLRAVPLVDRVPERDALWSALRRVTETGTVHAVVLSGPGGSGKSRLAEWLCQRAHEVGAANVLRATHSPIPGPTHGLGPMLRSYLRCQGLDHEGVSLRVEQIFRAHGTSHSDEWEALSEVIQPADPGRRGGIRFATPTERYVTVRRLLQAMAAERAIVLCLDDVHNALDTLRFAIYLLDYPARQALPVLLVLTATDEALADRKDEATALAELLDHDRAERIRVDALLPEHRPALVRGVLALEPELARRVEDRTAGNPLFAVQLVGDWVQRQALVAGPNGFHLREGADEQLPADVTEMWSRRVERMLARRTSEEGHALELAAVLGSEVDPVEWGAACLRAPAAHPSDALLEELLDQRLAGCGADGPGEGWHFSHAMLRESLEARAREAGRLPIWHRACAELLEDEARHRGRVTGALAERIGRHWLGALQPDRAVPPLLAGARDRVATGDYAVAEHLLAMRDEALGTLRVDDADPRWGDGWLLRHEIGARKGDYDAMEAWLARAEDAAARHGWAQVRDRARCLRGVRDRVHGRYAQALQYLQQVEEDAARRGDRTLMAESRLEVARTLLGSGDVAGTEHWARLALQEHEATGDGLGTGECWQVLGEAAKEAGRHGEASTLLRRAEGLFEELGHRWKTADALNSQGDVARSQGDLDLAASLYRRARGLLKAIGSRSWIFPEYNTGLVHLARGDHQRARGILEVAMAVFTEQQNSSAMAHAHLALAVCSATDEQWILWDDHLREARGLLSRTGFSDEDTARLATQAGRAAQDKEQRGRALDAYGLAAGLWRVLDRGRELADVEKVIAGL